MTQLIFSDSHSAIQYLGEMPYMGLTEISSRTVSFRATPNFGGETAQIEVKLKNKDDREIAKMDVTISVDHDTNKNILRYASTLASNLLDAENEIPLAAE